MGPGRFCLVQLMLATDVWCQLSLAISLRTTPTGVMRVNFAVWCRHRLPAPVWASSLGAHKDLPAGGYDMASEPSQRVSRFPIAPP